MTASSQPAFPQAALQWLTPAVDRARVLLLGRTAAPLAGPLARQDVRLVASDPTPDGVRILLRRAAGALPVVAHAEKLPFAPLSFDAVFVHQSLHSLSAAALDEAARVLAPGGHLAVSYTVRDDSVPWVRRLGALLRDVDPAAMSGAYGTDSVDTLRTGRFFGRIEERSHRLWVPISRVDLLDMVARRFTDLEPDRLNQLMGDVGALYESSARVPDPLLLPYRVACWRAEADHTQFTSQLDVPDDGLPIRL